MKELWRVIEDYFVKTWNITYDCFVFFSSKQQKEESAENFYGGLRKQSENCSLGDEQTTIIRDSLILNILDYDTQKGLLKKTVQ